MSEELIDFTEATLAHDDAASPAAKLAGPTSSSGTSRTNGTQTWVSCMASCTMMIFIALWCVDTSDVVTYYVLFQWTSNAWAVKQPDG